MLWKKLVRSIRDMPRAAYIFLRAVLALCCILLFLALVLFLCLEQDQADHALYKTALTLLEMPAGVLLLGLIGTVIFLDYAPQG